MKYIYYTILLRGLCATEHTSRLLQCLHRKYGSPPQRQVARFVLGIATLLSFFSTPTLGQWRQSEYEGWNRNDLGLIYKNGMLFTSSGGQGIGISRDGGETWQSTNLGERYSDEVVFSGDRLFAVGYNRIFISDNFGETWIEKLLPGGERNEVRDINCIRAYGDTLYLGNGTNNDEFDGKIFWSIDRGENWELLHQLTEKNITSIVQSDEGFLFVSTNDGIYTNRNGNWDKIYDKYVEDMALNNNKLYAVSCGDGVSVYDGENWNVLINRCSVGIDVFDGRVYAGDRGRLYVINEDDSYTRLDTEFNGRIGPIEITESTWYVGTEQGIYKSENKGENWIKIDDNQKNIQARGIALIKNELVISAGSGYYFISTDDGASFERIPFNTDMGPITSSPTGLVATSWQKYNLAPTPHEIPGNWNFEWRDGNEFLRGTQSITGILVLDDRILMATEGKGVIVSEDGGITWRESNAGIANDDLRVRHIHQHTDGDIYVATANYPHQIYRSDSKGRAWRRLNVPINNELTHAFTSIGNRLYIANNAWCDRNSNTSLMYTDREGAVWSRIGRNQFNNIQNECSFNNVYAFDGNIIAASRGNGPQLLHLSRDNGETWEDISEGIIFDTDDIDVRPWVNGIYASGDNLVVLIDDRGIWYRPLAELGISPLQPQLTEVTPTTAVAGETVTLHGDNFNAMNYWDNIVQFNGVEVKVTASTRTTLEVIVPEKISGEVSVSVSVRNVENTVAGLFSIPSPKITNISPRLVTTGDEITITGENFAASPENNSIQIGDEVLTVTSASATQLKATISEALRGAQPTKVTVTSRSVSTTSPMQLAFVAPVLVAVTPNTAAPATPNILLTAREFSPIPENNVVLFGAVEAPLNANNPFPNDSTLAVTVPTTARGNIEIRLKTGESISNGIPFSIVGGPVIESFTPTSGIVGDTVVITGSGFSSDLVNSLENKVLFGSQEVDVVSATENRLVVYVPPLISGEVPISVTVDNITTQSIDNFNVIRGFIQLRSPLGGASYEPGEVLSIRFESNLPGNVSIRLLKGGTPTLNLVTNIPIDTVFNWIIPNTVDVGSDYKILVISEDDASILDESPRNFRIGTSANITWGTPVGSDVFNIGSAPQPRIPLNLVNATVNAVNIEYQGVKRSLGIATRPVSSANVDGNIYSYRIPTEIDEDGELNDVIGADELGVRYRFGAVTPTDTVYSDWHTMRAYYPDGLFISYSSLGTSQTNYRMFTVALELDDPSLSANLLDDFGEYVNTQWRVFSYNPSLDTLNTEQMAIGEAISPGNAYWIIAKEKLVPLKRVFSASGTAVRTTIEEPFSIPVNRGFNLIGNAYPIVVDWNDIKLFNRNERLKLNKLVGYTGSFRERTQLLIGGGNSGFVFVEEDGRLYFPLPGNFTEGNSGGRLSAPEEINTASTISEAAWQIPLTIQSGEVNNTLAGIGMHPEANLSKDHFDGMRLPRFLNYADATFTHEDYFYPHFSTDVVPTQAEYTWQFTVESNTNQPIITLAWENDNIALQNQKGLFLEDLTTGRVMDMSQQKSYVFRNEVRQFKIHFGGRNALLQNLKPSHWAVYEAYPVPFAHQLHIPVALPYEGEVTVELYDIQGKRVVIQTNNFNASGFHEIRLDIEQTSKLQRGIYLYRVGFIGEWQTGKLIKE